LQFGEFGPFSFCAKSFAYVKMSFSGFKMTKDQPQYHLGTLIGSPKRCVSCDGFQKHFSCLGLMA
jgi:hypothetical protein